MWQPTAKNLSSETQLRPKLGNTPFPPAKASNPELAIIKAFCRFWYKIGSILKAGIGWIVFAIY
jgi:hypothetical protein